MTVSMMKSKKKNMKVLINTTFGIGKILYRIILESKRNNILDITVNDIMEKDYILQKGGLQ